MSPVLSDAKQSDALGQETDKTVFRPSTLPVDQALADPVGVVVVAISPASPPATHSCVVGQLMASSPSSAAACQVLDPPVGVVEVTTSFVSTAAHRWDDGHEMASPLLPVLIWRGEDQVNVVAWAALAVAKASPTIKPTRNS